MENYSKYEKLGVKTEQAKLLLELEIITDHYPIIPDIEIEGQEVIGFSFYSNDLVINNIDIEKMMDIIEKFTSLKKLTMTGIEQRGFTNIPQEIFRIKSLEYLDLSYNSLKEIPSSIGKLSSLKYLNLYNNLIHTLPEELGNLTSLIELNLGLNQVETLPKSLEKLDSLKKLDLSRNDKLRFIPTSILNRWKNNKLELNLDKTSIDIHASEEPKTIEIVDDDEFEDF